MSDDYPYGYQGMGMEVRERARARATRAQVLSIPHSLGYRV